LLKIQYLLIRKVKRTGQREGVKEKEGCTWYRELRWGMRTETTAAVKWDNAAFIQNL